MAVIELGGNYYTLAEEKGQPKIAHSYVPMQSNPIRLTGVTLRENDPSVGHYIHPSFPNGIGWTRMNRQNGRGVYGLRDATADTRFRPVTIGRLHESQTHAAPLDHIRAYCNWQGDFWGLFEQDYTATALEGLFVSKWGATSDTWEAVDGPTFNAATTSTLAAGFTLTTSHTVQSTFGNRIVIAIVYTSSSGGGASVPTGVDYVIGSAMTKLGELDAGDNTVSIWYRVAPATGANNCVVTVGVSQYIGAVISDYFFANQATPFGAVVTDSGTGTSTSLAVVGNGGGDLAIGGAGHTANEATTPGANQTELGDLAATVSFEVSEERAVSTSTTWGASWASNVAYAAIGAALLGDGMVTTPATTVAEGVRGFDMVPHKSTLTVLASRGGIGTELQFQVFRSTNGNQWTPYTNLPGGANSFLTTTITRRNSFDDDEGRLLDFNTLLLAAIYDGVTNNRINVYSTDDSGGTAWTAQGNTTDRHVHALLKWKDPTNLANQIAILVTERNVYKVNTTANTLDALLPEGILTGSADDGRGAVVGLDGALYLPLASGRIRKVEIAAENSFVFSFVGPVGDGLVTARQGHVNSMLVVPEPWLVVAYGGHAASKQASIFYIDYAVQKDQETGQQFQAWHSGYLESDANIDLYLLGYSQEDDAVARVFFALESATSAEMFHIEEAFTHPLGSTTIKYQTASYLRLPTDDFGDPNTTAGIYSARVDADALTAGSGGSGGATDEFITLQYGLDGNADTTTSLGDFLSGTKSLNFGTSGVGVGGKKIATKLTLDRGSTNTNTPLLLEFELLAENRLLAPRQWDFIIDLEATAQAPSQAPTASDVVQEVVITAIETAAETSTLLTFTTGQDTQTLVRIPNDRPPVFNLWAVDSSLTNTGYRTGFIAVHVTEVR